MIMEAKNAHSCDMSAVKPPSTINHSKRFFFISEAQDRLKQHPYNIDHETSGIVITEMIALLRKFIGSDNFEDICAELCDISRLSQQEDVRKEYN